MSRTKSKLSQTKMLIVLLLLLIARTDSCPSSRSSIEKTLNAARIPGLVAIVVNSTNILYEQAFGYQAPTVIQPNVPMKSDKSILILASLSKTFIVTAVMQLVESGQLDLDRDINQYLSPLPRVQHPRYPNAIITMRHILSHRTGIGPNLAQELKEQYLPGDDFTKSNLSQAIYRYITNDANWLPDPPGTIAMYSNAGASLGALIVQCITKINFEDYVRNKILQPLNINRTDAGYRLSDFESRKQDLVGHYMFNASFLSFYRMVVPQLNASRVGNGSDWVYIPPFSLADYPAGLLHMSARSLSLFFRSFMNNYQPLLKKTSSMTEILRVYGIQPQPPDVPAEYGLIWTWLQGRKRRLIGHRGSLPGFTHSMMANEKRTIGVILLSTGDISHGDAQAMDVSRSLVEIMDELFDCFDKSGSHRMNSSFTTCLIFLLLSTTWILKK